MHPFSLNVICRHLFNLFKKNIYILFAQSVERGGIVYHNKFGKESKKIVFTECFFNEQLSCKCSFPLSEYKAVETDDDHNRQKSILSLLMCQKQLPLHSDIC